MSTVRVRTTALGEFQCTVGICDCCSYCGSCIVWGADRRGTPVALEPWGDSETETEPHFNHCQQLLERRADQHGVEIPLSTWRGLLMLCHPDRYAGTVKKSRQPT